MSQENEKPQIAGSITYPENRDDNVSRNVPQPRQPHNLQGLLRFAMDATKLEDAPGTAQFGPMDEEKRKFLEDALKAMTIDVVEILHKNIKLLNNANTLSVDADPVPYMRAFDEILDFVDHIDVANDFHKIGGFTIFQPCFDSVHGCIRAGACDLLAELCQNNPYCQRVVTENNMLKQILEIIDNDPVDEARIKAVYALSCNVRENQKGLEQFLAFGGITSVLRAMQRNLDKLKTKCAFLLSCLSGQHKEVRTSLLEQDAIPILIGLIAEKRQPSHEHLLSLLVLLITDCPQAIEQCLDSRYNLKNILQHHLSQISDKEEFQEEISYCQTLLNTIFKNDQTETDR